MADPAPPVRRMQGHQACAAGIARRAFPWRQAKRVAPQARRREGLEPDGRDGEVGTGRSPQSPAVQGTDTPGYPSAGKSTHAEATRHGAALAMVLPPCRAAKAALRPAAVGGALAAVRPPGACCATRSGRACRPRLRSGGRRPWPGTKDRRGSRRCTPARLR